MKLTSVNPAARAAHVTHANAITAFKTSNSSSSDIVTLCR